MIPVQNLRPRSTWAPQTDRKELSTLNNNSENSLQYIKPKANQLSPVKNAFNDILKFLETECQLSVITGIQSQYRDYTQPALSGYSSLRKQRITGLNDKAGSTYITTLRRKYPPQSPRPCIKAVFSEHGQWKQAHAHKIPCCQECWRWENPVRS